MTSSPYFSYLGSNIYSFLKRDVVGHFMIFFELSNDKSDISFQTILNFNVIYIHPFLNSIPLYTNSILIENNNWLVMEGLGDGCILTHVSYKDKAIYTSSTNLKTYVPTSFFNIHTLKINNSNTLKIKLIQNFIIMLGSSNGSSYFYHANVYDKQIALTFIKKIKVFKNPVSLIYLVNTNGLSIPDLKINQETKPYKKKYKKGRKPKKLNYCKYKNLNVGFGYQDSSENYEGQMTNNILFKENSNHKNSLEFYYAFICDEAGTMILIHFVDEAIVLVKESVRNSCSKSHLFLNKLFLILTYNSFNLEVKTNQKQVGKVVSIQHIIFKTIAGRELGNEIGNTLAGFPTGSFINSTSFLIDSYPVKGNTEANLLKGYELHLCIHVMNNFVVLMSVVKLGQTFFKRVRVFSIFFECENGVRLEPGEAKFKGIQKTKMGLELLNQGSFEVLISDKRSDEKGKKSFICLLFCQNNGSLSSVEVPL